MCNDDPIDPLAVPEIFLDGISEIKIIEGVVRIVLVERQDGQRIVSGRLKIPLSELPEVIQALVISLTEAAKSIVKPPLSS